MPTVYHGAAAVFVRSVRGEKRKSGDLTLSNLPLCGRILKDIKTPIEKAREAIGIYVVYLRNHRAALLERL